MLKHIGVALVALAGTACAQSGAQSDTFTMRVDEVFAAADSRSHDSGTIVMAKITFTRTNGVPNADAIANSFYFKLIGSDGAAYSTSLSVQASSDPCDMSVAFPTNGSVSCRITFGRVPTSVKSGTIVYKGWNEARAVADWSVRK